MKFKNESIIAFLIMVIFNMNFSLPASAAGYRSCKNVCDQERRECGPLGEMACEQKFEACNNGCIARSVTAPHYIADDLKTYHGAIAYDKESGSWGYSVDNNTAAQAEAGALESCKKGSPGCQVYVRLTNQCGALAASPDGAFSWAADKTSQASEKRALASCRKNGNEGCEVKVTACTSR